MIGRRLAAHVRRHPVDTGIGVVGTLCAAAAFAVEPLVIAVPLVMVTILAGITLILRNSEGGEER